MNRAGPSGLALVVLLGAAIARGADAPATSSFQGDWTATNAGRQVFRGTWSAELAVATPNVALGTWALMDERGTALLGGTWSARKATRGGRGVWSARLAGTNQLLSGTWEADASTLAGSKTFRDLLTRAAEQQIAGVWRMRRTHGHWWLKARS
jgi:hypothetical protein